MFDSTMAMNPRIREILSQMGPAGYIAGIGRGFVELSHLSTPLNVDLYVHQRSQSFWLHDSL